MMSSIQGMIQSNNMNRGMQRSGQLFSGLSGMSNAKYKDTHEFSMTIDQEKLTAVELKWQKQNRSDRLKAIVAFAFVVMAFVAIWLVFIL